MFTLLPGDLYGQSIAHVIFKNTPFLGKHSSHVSLKTIITMWVMCPQTASITLVFHLPFPFSPLFL